MAAYASFSGKFQIDNGQSLVVNNQVSLGWSASLVLTLPQGTPAVPAGPNGNPPAQPAVTQSQKANVLDGSVTAQMVAIHADAYPNDTTPGQLTVTFQGATVANKTDLNLTGDLVIANADLLQKICADWASITVTSTIAKVITVQILVVWSPA